MQNLLASWMIWQGKPTSPRQLVLLKRSKFRCCRAKTLQMETCRFICNEVFHQLTSSCANISEFRILAEDVDLKAAMVICGHRPFIKKLELTDCGIAQIVLSYFLD